MKVDIPEELTAQGLLLLMLYKIDPSAAIGAAAGCLFHLCMSGNQDFFYRFKMTLFSAIVGYAAGTGFGGSYTMLVASSMAALASSMFIVFTRVISNNEDAPIWVKYLIETILRIRK